MKSLKRTAGTPKWIMKKSLVVGAVQILGVLGNVRITGKGFGNIILRITKGMVRPPGIGPGALAWEANMLPLHYRRKEELEI